MNGVLAAIQRQEAERQRARDRAAEALQCAPGEAERYAPLGPEPCAHDKDIFGHCLGPCQGETWDRAY